MMSKSAMGWTAVIVGVLVALTTYLNWTASWNYLWAALVIIWGIMSFK